MLLTKISSATATIFVSFLAGIRNSTKTENPDVQELLQLEASLKGVYTFGNPRTGSTSFAKSINQYLFERKIPFFRYRNANDIVSIIPPGGGFWPLLFDFFFERDLQRVGFIFPMNPILDFAAIGNEIRVNYSGWIQEEICVDYAGTDYLAHSGFLEKLGDFLERLGWTFLNSFANFFSNIRNIGPARLHYDFINFNEEVPWTEIMLQFALPSFLFDHFPSQYAFHILKAKQIRYEQEHEQRLYKQEQDQKMLSSSCEKL